MPGNEPDLRFWTREQMLGHVRTGATARRRRRLRAGAAAGLAAFAVLTAGAAVALTRAPDRSATVAAAAPETPLTVPPTTVAAPMTTAPPPTSPATTATTARPATTTTRQPAATTTTTELVCQDSHDPACGEFRFEPAPVNQPLTVQVVAQQVGGPTSRTFTFHVSASDPDAPVSPCASLQWGDGVGTACPMASMYCPEPPRYGPWTPPETTPGRYQDDLTHTYDKPGTYEVQVAVFASPECPPAPYASSGSKTVTVVVP